MRKWLAMSAAAIVMLAWVGAPDAHHSSSMFDISSPIWVKGRVIAYEAVNPHAMLVLEEDGADGTVRRWTVEGPHPGRTRRMGVQPEPGDALEVCGFALKEGISLWSSPPDPYGLTEQFVHGHAVLMPDGHWELFGPYGSLAECIGSSDKPRETWLHFIDNADPSVRELWCGQRRFARQAGSRRSPPFPTELIDEINGQMANPCQ
jgi:hypothetical protein